MDDVPKPPNLLLIAIFFLLVLLGGAAVSRLSGPLALNYVGKEHLLAQAGGLLTSGLIGHWPFDGNANDTAGSNNGTTAGGPLYVAGKFGSAVQFDGVDDLVRLNNTAAAGYTNFTFSMWFKSNSTATNKKLFSERLTTNPPDYKLMEFVYNDNDPVSDLNFWYRDENQAESVCRTALNCVETYFDLSSSDPNRVSNNVWHHVAGVRSGTTWKIYYDGILKSTKTLAVTNISPDKSCFGAACNDTPSNFYTGLIDEARVYNRALNDAEVSALYTGVPPTPATPTAVTSGTCGGRINLTWASVIYTAGYKLYRDGGATNLLSADYMLLNYTDNVTPGSSHTYRLVAANPAGDSPQSVATASTLASNICPPAAPLASSVAVGVCGGNINVTWEAVSGASSYKLYRDGVMTNLLSAGYSSLDFIDGVIPSSSHSYKLIATNVGGDSALSPSSATINASSACTYGDALIKRVGFDDAMPTAPVGTVVQVNALASQNVNPASYTSLITGTSHTVKVTDTGGFTKTAGTCFYPIAGSACSVGSLNLTPNCNGTLCSLTFNVLNGQVSKVVFKYLDTTAPTVSLTAPLAGPVSGTLLITAEALDNDRVAGVQFMLDGLVLQAEVTSSPYSISWDTTTASAGTHMLTAIVRDAAGNITASSDVPVTVFDTSAPSVSLTNPPDEGTVSNTTTVSATASDDVGVVGVRFKLDGLNLQAEDTTAPYSISWNTLVVSDGVHILTATARDAIGNVTVSSPVSVTVDNSGAVKTILVDSEYGSMAGTSWSIDGGGSHSSGAVIAPVSATQHTVHVTKLPGYGVFVDWCTYVSTECTMLIDTNYSSSDLNLNCAGSDCTALVTIPVNATIKLSFKYVVPPARPARCAVGYRMRTTASTDIYASPATTALVLETRTAGQLMKIVTDPSGSFSNPRRAENLWWCYANFDTGFDGWVIDETLQRVFNAKYNSL